MRVGNSPLLSSRLRRGSSHLEKASLPRQTPRIGSYSNRDASSALAVAAAAAPPLPLPLLAAPSARCPRSFILYPPFTQVRRPRSPPESSPEELSRHRPRHAAAAPAGLCVPAQSGVPARPAAAPRVPAQPLAGHLRLGSSAGLGADRGLGGSVCARVGHVRARCRRAGGEERGRAPRGCCCQPGERHGEPGPERCPRTGAWAEMRAGMPVSRRAPGGRREAPGGARCQHQARLQARYRCGFGRSSLSLPCVQLPVMLSPASSFLYL